MPTTSSAITFASGPLRTRRPIIVVSVIGGIAAAPRLLMRSRLWDGMHAGRSLRSLAFSLSRDLHVSCTYILALNFLSLAPRVYTDLT